MFGEMADDARRLVRVELARRDWRLVDLASAMQRSPAAVTRAMTVGSNVGVQALDRIARALGMYWVNGVDGLRLEPIQ